eukprot:TRINITY_DN9588_c0_g1_i1.p1 TRINITY_DN9588_c0_g1~~TRINITY_DN9588_c0_g1_i1.p1  ORF type:complete len:658 (-),score=74.47 TRINITY_DN9588_c0_g1_i1:49-2022(-)
MSRLTRLVSSSFRGADKDDTVSRSATSAISVGVFRVGAGTLARCGRKWASKRPPHFRSWECSGRLDSHVVAAGVFVKILCAVGLLRGCDGLSVASIHSTEIAEAVNFHTKQITKGSAQPSLTWGATAATTPKLMDGPASELQEFLGQTQWPRQKEPSLFSESLPHKSHHGEKTSQGFTPNRRHSFDVDEAQVFAIKQLERKIALVSPLSTSTSLPLVPVNHLETASTASRMESSTVSNLSKGNEALPREFVQLADELASLATIVPRGKASAEARTAATARVVTTDGNDAGAPALLPRYVSEVFGAVTTPPPLRWQVPVPIIAPTKTSPPILLLQELDSKAAMWRTSVQIDDTVGDIRSVARPINGPATMFVRASPMLSSSGWNSSDIEHLRFPSGLQFPPALPLPWGQDQGLRSRPRSPRFAGLHQKESQEFAEKDEKGTPAVDAVILGLVYMIPWLILVTSTACYFDRNKMDVYLGPNAPTDGQWAYDLPQCLHDKRLCIFSCCCAPVRWALTMRLAGLMGYWPAFGLFTLFALLNCICFYIGCIPLIALAVYHRQKIRLMFNIHGCTFYSITNDTLAYAFCGVCAIVQEARQLEIARATNHEALPAVENGGNQAVGGGGGGGGLVPADGGADGGGDGGRGGGGGGGNAPQQRMQI